MHEVLVLLFIALMSQSAFAIDCYSCESTYEENCGEDNFEAENHFKLLCEDLVPPRFLENEIETFNATACMKKIYIEDGWRKVVRGCYFGDTNSTLTSCSQDPTLDPVEDISCHICDNESYCNGAKGNSYTLRRYYGMTLIFLAMTKFMFCLK